jgi:hypothetical protein
MFPRIVLPSSSRKGSPYLQRKRYYRPSTCKKQLAQGHTVTSKKTSNFIYELYIKTEALHMAVTKQTTGRKFPVLLFSLKLEYNCSVPAIK